MGAKKPKTPKMPDPIATPDQLPEVEDEAMRKVRRRRGYSSTVLTGALAPKPQKSTVLGG